MSAQSLIERFVLSTLVVPVITMEPGRLSVSFEHPEKLDLLRTSAQDTMRSVGAPLSRSSELVEGLLTNRLKHDLCYVALPQGKNVILVKESVYSQLEEREIVEQVHKQEVQSASMRGEFIPDDLLRYYRDKSRPVFSNANPM